MLLPPKPFRTSFAINGTRHVSAVRTREQQFYDQFNAWHRAAHYDPDNPHKLIPVRGFVEKWTPQRNPQQRGRRAIRQILEEVGQIIVQYADHLPLTIRQIFYRLVARFEYDKTERDYIRLQETLLRARRAGWRIFDGRLLFDAIRDDGFTAQKPSFFRDANHFLPWCGVRSMVLANRTS
jgi:hypothetical protein